MDLLRDILYVSATLALIIHLVGRPKRLLPATPPHRLWVVSMSLFVIPATALRFELITPALADPLQLLGALGAVATLPLVAGRAA